MASARLRIHLHRSGVLLTLLLGLAGGCKNNSTNDKVDAGQRRYCLASDAGSDKVGSDGSELGEATDGGGSGDAIADSAGAPALLDARGDGGSVEAGNVRADGGMDGVDSGLAEVARDGTGETGGTGGGSGGIGGTGGAGGTAGIGGTIAMGGSDAGADARADGSNGANDGPDARLDASNDANYDAPASDGVVSPDLRVGDGNVADGPAGSGTPDSGSPADHPATPDVPPAVCGLGGLSWAKPWVKTSPSDAGGPVVTTAAFEGLANAPDGTPWATGKLYAAFDFGTGAVPYTAGDQATASRKPDIFLVKVDPATGLATAAFDFGDTGNQPQDATGAAVASSGNVGLIGSFTGEIDFTANNSDGSGPSGIPGTAGTDFLQNASSIPFYAVFDAASTGTYVTPKTVHMVDVGTGALLSVGSNPGQNAIAICGKTSKAVPNWSSSGATKGVILPTGTAVAGGGMDIVVAKIDASTGAVIWGEQFGGAGDQICEAVAIDNNGDVIITGNYNGTLNFGGSTTAFPAADSSLALLFVAKLNGATGAPVSALTWGTAGRSDAYGLTVDANNNIVLAGSIGAAIDLGGGISMPWAGLTDAFVMKLDSTLAPQWAKSFGDVNYDQKAKSVAMSSSGDVFFGGNFEGGLGALGLTASSNTALDAFSAQLSGVDGSLVCAHAYGDAAGTQGITNITVARVATAALADSILVGGVFSSEMLLGSFDLNTSDPNLSAGFIARMAP